MEVEAIRLAVYGAFGATGTAPSTDDLVGVTGAAPADVRAALRELADGRHLVLDPDGHVVMAHPFSAVPLGFSVMGESTLWWGGCAWDSFALAHLLTSEPDVLVATRCPACGTPHAFVVDRTAPPPGDQVAHFLVPAARMWDDVVHTCAHQRVFCGEPCVDAWLARTGNARGDVLDLRRLWLLASHWYDGRLEPGYVRREPSAAADYLRSVGLSGPFWGL